MAGDITIYRMTNTTAGTNTYLTFADKVDFNYVPQKSDEGYYAPDGGTGAYPAGTALSRFGDGGPKPDNNSFVNAYDLEGQRRETDVPNPFQNDPRKPDTGYKGTTYTFDLAFRDSGRARNGSTGAAAIQVLKNWEEGFSETDTLRRGRFGIRIYDRPEYNVVPDATGGLKMVKFRIDKTYQHFGIVRGTLIMELGG